TVLLAAIAFLLLGGTARAVPTPACPEGKKLSDYIALGAGGCLLGDKVFSNFALKLGPNTGADTAPKADQISVTPLDVARDPGFPFTGDPEFQSSATGFFSYRLAFTVKVQADGAPIKDASAEFSVPTLAADGSVDATETICLGDLATGDATCPG